MGAVLGGIEAGLVFALKVSSILLPQEMSKR
jgi:hypothetical protein